MINTDKLAEQGFVFEDWFDKDSPGSDVYDLYFAAYKKEKGDLTIEVSNAYQLIGEDEEQFKEQTVSLWLGEYQYLLPHINSDAKLHLLLWILDIT